ncbi:MAG: hypothetical protein GX424_04410 [Clostridiales bacterium]|nr:hypothetical protein [Clostridiales bacterium]
MKRLKNIGLLSLLAVVLLSFGAVPVYATTNTVSSSAAAKTETPVKSSSSAAVSSAKPAQASVQPVSSANPVVSSTPPQTTASSKKTVVYSSKRTRATTASKAVSSAASSALSSVISSSSEEASSQIVLPSVGSIAEDNPLDSMQVQASSNSRMNWIGILSWACIVLGMLVVAFVVFSNRRPPRGGPGRKRYRKKPGQTRKKHLLNDKYYRNMKY